MAVQIISGQEVWVQDLGFIDTPDQVYGVGLDSVVFLATAWTTPADDGVYGVDVWSVIVAQTRNYNLGTIDEVTCRDRFPLPPVLLPGPPKPPVPADEQECGDRIYLPTVFVLPPASFRRIQLDGGGRKLFESSLGDEAVERFFELWRDGHPYPLHSVSNPVFSWRSPTGATGESVARVIDPSLGRVGVHLFEPGQIGEWLVQVRFVEGVNFDIGQADREAPYARPPGAQEFWRYLPKALVCLVRNQGGW